MDEETIFVEEDKLETWMYDLPENTDQNSTVVSFDVSSSPNDFNVSTIINYIDKGSIVIPPYQRNYVWDRKRASRLIESLILGLPIPQLFLYQEDKNRFSILDGQQRLLTIYFFYKMRFPKKNQRSVLRDLYVEFNQFEKEVLANNDYFSEFSLFFGRNDEGASNFLQGEKYDTLGEHQLALDMRTVRCVVIKQNEPDEADASSVFEIFDRLNTGGVNLKPQQIRSNLYHGTFYKNLHELNKIQIWRRLLGKPNPDDNCRDQELILRMLGMMFYGPDGYQPTMTNFLNKFSKHLQTLEKIGRLSEVEYVSKFFRNFLEKLSERHFKHFFSDGRFSIGTAESVFYAATKQAWHKKNPDLTLDFTPEMVEKISEGVRPFLLEGSAGSENVRKRLNLAREVINES